MLSEDLYATLGLSPSASEDEVKTAYRQLAKMWHPDKNKGTSATSQFTKIGRAFEILSDRDKRRKWENQRRVRRAESDAFKLGEEATIPGARSPPRSPIWEWGGRAHFQVEEIFVPRESKRNRRRVTRVVTTTLPDGVSKFSEAQDYALTDDGDWISVGKAYVWNPDEEAVNDLAPHQLLATVPLFSGEHLLSKDASHDATVEPDGHLRVRESGSRRVIWQTGHDRLVQTPGFALLQFDGNLIVCAGASPDLLQAVVWSSNSAQATPRGVNPVLSLNDRGELSILSDTGVCLWASHGCSVNWRTARNALRITVRRLFDRSALKASVSSPSPPSLFRAIWSFVNFLFWDSEDS